MSTEDLPRGRHHSLLVDQLADERAKKASLEQRGVAVISTSGALVTITLGFVALATRDGSPRLQSTVVLLLLTALAGLVAASAAGLLVNLPARTPVVDAGDLADIATGAAWETSDLDSSRTEYQLQARILIGLRDVNQTRARVLFLALLLEVLALVLMTTSVVLTLSPMV